MEDEVVMLNGIPKQHSVGKGGALYFTGEASDENFGVLSHDKSAADIPDCWYRMPFMDGLELSRTGEKEFNQNRHPPAMSLTMPETGHHRGLDYLLKPLPRPNCFGGDGEKVADVIEKNGKRKAIQALYRHQRWRRTRLAPGITSTFEDLLTNQLILKYLNRGRI